MLEIPLIHLTLLLDKNGASVSLPLASFNSLH